MIVHAALAAFLLVLPALGSASELKPDAAQGFDRYVRQTEMRLQTELAPGAAFLWVEGLPEEHRSEAISKLQHGEVVSERLKTKDVSGEMHTPGALIHHWVGTVFIPGVTVGKVLSLLQDYDHHTQYYSPDVVKSKTLAHAGDNYKVYLRLKRKKIVTVVLDTEYDVQYEQLDAAHAQSRSYSTRIVEVENPGEANEHALPPGDDHGFLWRLNSYWRFSEKDGGVYVQCEAISLTRDIPAGLNWLIGPFIESIPKESLEFTLQSTRKAVVSRGPHAQ